MVIYVADSAMPSCLIIIVTTCGNSLGLSKNSGTAQCHGFVNKSGIPSVGS